MEKCPVCGSKLAKDAKACAICGTAFESMSHRCPLCETEVDEFASICPNCGAELTPTETTGEPIAETKVAEIEEVDIPTEEEKIHAEDIAKDVLVDVELEELVKLSGVGPLKAKILYEAGYTDLRKLKQASVVELMNIRGIGRKSAGEIKAALREHTLEEIRGIELTQEVVGAENQCPLCGTIVSVFEKSCYECGCVIKPDELDNEDSDRLALSYYDSKLLRTPDNKDLWYARGATLAKMEEFEQALNSFNRAIEIDPSFQTAWMSKAEVYNRLGEAAKAAECYSHIITSASGGQIPGLHHEEDAAQPVFEDEEEEDLKLEAPVHDEEKLPELEAPAPEPQPETVEAREEPVPEPEPVVEDQPAAEEQPKVDEPTVEEGPQVVKPTVMPAADIEMDYTKPPSRPDYMAMDEVELKKYLSKRASYVKPYLALAKELAVDINHAKRLIARAVSESKQGELRVAVQVMDEGIEFAEVEFRRKISEDIENLAGVIRDLKVTGVDTGEAVEMISDSKAALDEGEIIESVETLRRCLAYVEKIAS